MTENTETRVITEEDVVDVLRTIYDPEIPVNIYDLGLIYEIRIETASRLCTMSTIQGWTGCLQTRLLIEKRSIRIHCGVIGQVWPERAAGAR